MDHHSSYLIGLQPFDSRWKTEFLQETPINQLSESTLLIAALCTWDPTFHQSRMGTSFISSDFTHHLIVKCLLFSPGYGKVSQMFCFVGSN